MVHTPGYQLGVRNENLLSHFHHARGRRGIRNIRVYADLRLRCDLEIAGSECFVSGHITPVVMSDWSKLASSHFTHKFTDASGDTLLIPGMGDDLLIYETADRIEALYPVSMGVCWCAKGDLSGLISDVEEIE
jgi:hypothetical protein